MTRKVGRDFAKRLSELSALREEFLALQRDHQRLIAGGPDSDAHNEHIARLRAFGLRAREWKERFRAPRTRH